MCGVCTSSTNYHYSVITLRQNLCFAATTILMFGMFGKMVLMSCFEGSWFLIGLPKTAIFICRIFFHFYTLGPSIQVSNTSFSPASCTYHTLRISHSVFSSPHMRSQHLLYVPEDLPGLLTYDKIHLSLTKVLEHPVCNLPSADLNNVFEHNWTDSCQPPLIALLWYICGGLHNVRGSALGMSFCRIRKEKDIENSFLWQSSGPTLRLFAEKIFLSYYSYLSIANCAHRRMGSLAPVSIFSSQKPIQGVL